ncbi:MAG: Rpn family recombination-promoting nuclease/putative transposase [Oscillatoria princeps RMCB-10]|nr:Rpn family recombination-promoting nuclease/putative transposase [Oscillatoria princeps RMCB-10]
MITDSIFYVLFETLPRAFFELLGESAAAAEG